MQNYNRELTRIDMILSYYIYFFFVQINVNDKSRRRRIDMKEKWLKEMLEEDKWKYIM